LALQSSSSCTCTLRGHLVGHSWTDRGHLKEGCVGVRCVRRGGGARGAANCSGINSRACSTGNQISCPMDRREVHTIDSAGQLALRPCGAGHGIGDPRSLPGRWPGDERCCAFDSVRSGARVELVNPILQILHLVWRRVDRA
jgi:hypothetical protein